MHVLGGTYCYCPMLLELTDDLSQTHMQATRCLLTFSLKSYITFYFFFSFSQHSGAQCPTVLGHIYIRFL